MQEGFDPLGELAQARPGHRIAPPGRTLDEKVSCQVHGRHHRELPAVDRTGAIPKAAHGLVHQRRYPLQLARMGIGADPILVPEHSDRHRSLAGHGQAPRAAKRPSIWSI